MRSPLVPLEEHPAPGGRAAVSLLVLLLSLASGLGRAAASDRSLCFKLPPADSLVVKPELATDAAEVLDDPRVDPLASSLATSSRRSSTRDASDSDR